MRLIINHIVDISNDLACLYSCHDVASDHVRRLTSLYLRQTVKNIQVFYTENCAYLKPDVFVYLYSSFKHHVHYSFDNFKIINQHYLEHLKKKFMS